MKTFTRWRVTTVLTLLALVALSSNIYSQSIARQWSDVQLSCIRKDRPRPTVQARHLAQGAIVMWDAFAVYDDDAQPVLLGQTFNGFTSTFNGIAPPADVAAAQHECLSYAMYRYLWQRYATAPTWVPSTNLAVVQGYINDKMTALGYDPAITSTDYSDGDPAKLGNYIAAQMQAYALQDGANQAANFGNTWYVPVNGQLSPHFPNNPFCTDPNRWQPLCLTVACEQGTGPGFPDPCVPVNEPCNAPCLSPEFGEVKPFALTSDQLTIKNRDNHDWKIYLDPGDPPYLDLENQTGMESIYKWGFVLNSIWHSHHTSTDGVMIDISPNSVGNVLEYPVAFEDYPSFYDMYNGGDPGIGYAINPVTGLPYEEQIVQRGDYTRVLSQYWADGPNSETPPGHWFKIVNEVNDNPLQVNMWNGEGELLGDLEWDVRCYLAMGGGIMDAAIACWSAKGYYDYTRPIFAIRAMCDFGQCSDDQLPNYHPAGIPLVPGYIEMIEVGDPLAGDNDEYVNDIKVYTWLGPEASTGEDGVGWKRGSEWWTYQNATFVTPPFPGYYSGHSTYSRTGAEVMTLITGDEYFPGGMGEFVADPGYLSADTDGGPSTQIRLQWAKYRDASDQCSLSRIWGGLHPPQDDLPGRANGAIIGPQAFTLAETYMNAGIPHIASIAVSDDLVTDADMSSDFTVTITFTEDMDQTIDPVVAYNWDNPANTINTPVVSWPAANTCVITYVLADVNEELGNVRWQISGAKDLQDNLIVPALSALVRIDTRNPMVESFTSVGAMFNAASADNDQLMVDFTFDEAMDMNADPSFSFSESLDASVVFNSGSWNMDEMTYSALFDIVDNNDEYDMVGVMIASATDAAGNEQVLSENLNVFSIDTKEPVATASADDNALNQADAGDDALTLTFTFDEAMDNSATPTITFPGEDPTTAGLEMTFGMWNVDATQFIAMFDLADVDAEMFDIEVASASAMDAAGNTQSMSADEDLFSIDTKQPSVTVSAASDLLLSDANTGAWSIGFTFDEAMDTNADPLVVFPVENVATSIVANGGDWAGNTYTANFNVLDAGIELDDIDMEIVGASDAMMNGQLEHINANHFSIDTRNPEVILLTANDDDITDENLGELFELTIIFDEPMDTESTPSISFPDENPSSVISFNAGQSGWLTGTDNVYVAKYTMANGLDVTLLDIDVQIAGLNDAAGNEQVNAVYEDFFDIQVGVGVSELGDQTVTIYPNPALAGKDIVVAMNQIPADLVLQVYDANGALVEAQTKANQSGTQMMIDTQNLAAGTYYINLSTAGNSVSMKVQVVK